MQLSNAPAKLTLPFANSGAKNTIPVPSQVSITPGAASLTDGFPPLTRTLTAAGGVPPSGLDFNGILFEISAIARWAASGAGFTYDSVYAADVNVGGYPKGARVLRTDARGYWLNTTDNNATDPEAGGAGWVPDFVSGAAAVTMTNANVTLTPLQYGFPIVVIAGALTANLNLVFPAIATKWIVINNTTGNFSITAKTAAGTGVVVTGVQIIVGDGTNILAATPSARIRLSAPLTLYVSTTGSDSNTGLIVGAPFATINKAYQTLLDNYDLNGYQVTIQLADGTYTAQATFQGNLIGVTSQPPVILNGNAVTPSNVIINTTSTDAVFADTSAVVLVQNMQLQTTTAGNCLRAVDAGKIIVGAGVIFGACANSHISSAFNGTIGLASSYTIAGAAQVHYDASHDSNINCNAAITVTITGTPAFGIAFARGANLGLIYLASTVTWSGSATGLRYTITGNGVIFTNGQATTWLPGGTAGTTATGGQYL